MRRASTSRKAPGTDDRVDVTLKFEEQNRNQLNFGLGVSQYEGLYGTFAYTAGNFLGRGESVTVALQRGTRSKLYQVGISEPYLFDRPISASAELYSRKYDFYGSVDNVAYSEVREGGSVSIGRPLGRFNHGYVNYTYERIAIAVSKELLKASGSGSTSASRSSTPTWTAECTSTAASCRPSSTTRSTIRSSRIPASG